MLKVDVAMWAKNGERTLPSVLKRIDEVIPTENINRRLFIDDKSIDQSRQIAKDFNWEIHDNKSGFICGGANTALSLVETEFFVSIEQDLYLNKHWWDRIPKLIQKRKDAITAQGVRVILNRGLSGISKWAIFRKRTSKTLDNNIWRTKLLKMLGGFPNDPIAVDSVLDYFYVRPSGLKWIVDFNVVSIHLKPMTVYQYLRHLMLNKRKKHIRPRLWRHGFREVIRSPVTAALMLLIVKDPFALPVYISQNLAQWYGSITQEVYNPNWIVR